MSRGIVAAVVLVLWAVVCLTVWDGRTRDIMAALLIVSVAIAAGVTTTRATYRWLTRRDGR